MSITQLERPLGAASVAFRMRAVVEEMASIVASLDVSSMDGSDASAAALLFAEAERLANAGKTLTAGRVAEVGHYRAEGFDNPGRWLAARTKASGWEAARTLDSARHLADPELVLTRNAFVAGRLTATQATEITSAAAKAPHQQDRLLALARRETVTQLKNECRQIRLARKHAENPKERRDRIVGEMAFGTRTLGDDLSELHVRMPTSWLALIVAAIGEQCDAVFARARDEGRTDPHQVYMVEALVTLLLFGSIGDAGNDSGAEGAGDEEARDADEDADPGCEHVSEPTADVDGDSDAQHDRATEPAATDNRSRRMDPDDGTGRSRRTKVDDGGGGLGDTGRDHITSRSSRTEVDDGGGHRVAVVGVPAPVFNDDGGLVRDRGDGGDDLDALYDELLAALDGEARPAHPRPDGRKRRGRCRCGGRVTPKAKIIARVDQSALLRGYAIDGEMCEIAGIGPVSVATVRELWPDAVVKLVLTDGIEVRNVVHLGRKATEAMETAMQFENPLCSNIACDH